MQLSPTYGYISTCSSTERARFAERIEERDAARKKILDLRREEKALMRYQQSWRSEYESIKRYFCRTLAILPNATT